jgi:hypothetical protein
MTRLQMRRKFPAFGGQKGSITVMIAFLLPVMVLMLAMIVNISQLVFTKIKLQATVDACALSAAAVQSAGLNEIADLNMEMAKENQKARWILASDTWYDFGQAQDAKNFFYNSRNGVIDYIRRYQKEANAYFSAKAEDVAEDVRQRNFPQSFLFARHDTRQLTALREKPTDAPFDYFTESFSDGSPVPTLNWFDPDDPRFADDHDGSMTIEAQRMTPLSDEFRILEKVEKTSPTYVNYELVLPPHPFAVADAVFRGMPELRARAAARPAGGNIYRERPIYGAVLAK